MIALLAYQISYWYISNRLWVIVETLKIGNIHTHGHTHTHTHTSGRQLKITFLDVLDYSEYSDTNISNFFFVTWCAWNHDLRSTASSATSTSAEYCLRSRERYYIKKWWEVIIYCLYHVNVSINILCLHEFTSYRFRYIICATNIINFDHCIRNLAI